MKIKLTNIFKIIVTAILIIAFTIPVISCKPPVVEKQVVEQQKEGKGEVTEVIIPSETKETPPVVEETPKEIEWEGIRISPIEGSNSASSFIDLQNQA